jgi:DNA-binding NarL/FixJ family response regulator
MSKIRIVLADDHAILRAGLRSLLDAEPDLEVVGEAATTPEAGERAIALAPDLLILDLNMPGGEAISVVGMIRAARPETRILILTMHDDPAYARSALAAGANGYVVKTADAAELITAIRAVYRGRIFLDVGGTRTPPLGVPGRRDPQPEAPESPAARLSDREEEVLRLVADGYTNKQIAQQLELSVKTVETYRMRLMQKLDLHTRAELVRYLRSRPS